MVRPKGDFDSAVVGSMRRRVVPPSCMSEEQFHLDEICTDCLWLDYAEDDGTFISRPPDPLSCWTVENSTVDGCRRPGC
ncbi:hypothetical protein PVAP13_1NG225157 [Panicum virgatum]|uniref:Uncharacterized protein n=1 Tax=Panicum virgatum TaxID=38727 RepID=A0A8T0WX95_PANVG|nr:hypothetical protein PVAP13_1NG225157 [Panicum virgatum]